MHLNAHTKRFYFFSFSTKRKLKWAASVKRTPLSLTYAEWWRRWRHYRQQKILLEPEEQTLASCFLLLGKAFLLMRFSERETLRQRPQDVGVWLGTRRLGRWGPVWWCGVAGRGKRAGILFGREGVWFGVCKCADGNLVSHTGLDMYRLAMATKAYVTNPPKRGGLKHRLFWARLGSCASLWPWQ